MSTYDKPMQHWYSKYDQPPLEEMNRTGSDDWVQFVIQSNKITPMIYRKLRDEVGEPFSDKKILDFGSGVGRVALHLHSKWGAPSHCRDVNKTTVRYLKKQLKGVDCKQSSYEPPLDFEDNFFDAVYSVSVWTHLPIDLQLPWLMEIKRVLKPGGTALLTTSGALAVRMRAKRGVPGWAELTPEHLAEQGILYRGYQSGPDGAGYSKIDADYGLTAHHPSYIKENWSRVMEVKAVHERVIDDIQDLVILRKPG